MTKVSGKAGQAALTIRPRFGDAEIGTARSNHSEATPPVH